MATYNYFVINNQNTSYRFTGLPSDNPTLNVSVGDTLVFNIIANGHPFWIKTNPVTGTAQIYNNGITNNGIENGTLTFVIPQDAPSQLFYICQFHSNMFGIINIAQNNNTTTTTSTTTSTTSSTTTSTTTTSSTTSTTTTTITTPTTPVPIVFPTSTTTTTTTLAPVLEVNSYNLVNNQLSINWSTQNILSSEIDKYRIQWKIQNSQSASSVNVSYTSTTYNLDINNLPIFNLPYDITVSAVLKSGLIVSDTFEYTRVVATTTTTTTTTDSPFSIIIDRTNLDICDCGIVTLPKGSFFDSNRGLKIMIKDDAQESHVDLIHDREILLFREQKFITVSNIIKDHVTAKNLVVYINSNIFERISIENVISITIKEKNTKQILAHKLFGGLNQKTKIRSSALIDKPSLVLTSESEIDLYDNALILEFNSICDYNNQPCCDQLPTDIQISSLHSCSGVGTSGNLDFCICVPLEDFYTETEINRITTTTPHPNTVIFTQNLSVVKETTSPNLNKSKLTFKAKTYYNTKYTYFIEKVVNNSCTTRIIQLTEADSDKLITVYDPIVRNELTQYRVFINSPEKKYSNTFTFIP